MGAARKEESFVWKRGWGSISGRRKSAGGVWQEGQPAGPGSEQENAGGEGRGATGEADRESLKRSEPATCMTHVFSGPSGQGEKGGDPGQEQNQGDHCPRGRGWGLSEGEGWMEHVLF